MKILKRLFGNTLYFAGCMSRNKYGFISENYTKILRKIGIEFIYLNDKEPCCGLPLYNAGFFDKFEEHKKYVRDLLEQYNVKKIIFSCPSCYDCFKKYYNLDVELEHITQTINNAILDNKLKINKKFDLVAAYHDPCHLSRNSIIEEPRNILKFLGFKLKEPIFSGKYSTCCGGGGGVRSNFENLSLKLAKARINEFGNVDYIITSCPMCYSNLSSVADNVYELSEILIKAMEVKK